MSSPAPPTEKAPAAPAAHAPRQHRVLVWILIVVASLIGLIGTLTLWIDRQMLDNHAWTRATQQVVQNPQVQSTLSTYIVNQLYEHIDVPGSLQNVLPPRLKPLAGPLSSALEQGALRVTSLALAQPRVQNRIVQASSVMHQKLVNVLENKTGYGISTGNGVVTVNLHSLVTQVGGQLGVPSAALAKVPADAGQITVMKSDQLSAAQTGVRILRIASAWVLILVLALFALAVYFARGARRAALRNIGWAFIIVGLIDLVLRRVVGNYVIDAISSGTYRGSVRAVWLIETSILGQIGLSAILYGVVTVVGAVLAGPSHAATKVRGWFAPVLNEQPGIAGIILGIAYLLLILWGPTYALRQWWGVLLFAGLIALGVVALRRQTLQEFPARELPSG